MILSIIIPFYNGTKHIRKILEQIIEQSNSDDIEVIIVNDGSTEEESIELDHILDRYKEDCTFRVIRQGNLGQGEARNVGLRNAQGEYIIFIDQDDQIESGYFKRMISEIEVSQADVVVSGYCRKSFKGNVLSSVLLKDKSWCKFMNITPWGKIYRLSFLRDNNLEFLPVKLGEDIYFSIAVYSHTDSIRTIQYIGYNWMANPISYSNTEHKTLVNGTDLQELFDQLILMDTAAIWKKDKQYEFFLLKTCIYHILGVTKQSELNSTMDYKRRLWCWMELNFPDFKNNEYISLSGSSGERFVVRTAVTIFMLADRLGVLEQLLRLYKIV